MNKEKLKKQVEIICDFLANNKCEKCGTSTSISRSSAYHLLAKIYGYKNWNTLSAKLKDEEAK